MKTISLCRMANLSNFISGFVGFFHGNVSILLLLILCHQIVIFGLFLRLSHQEDWFPSTLSTKPNIDLTEEKSEETGHEGCDNESNHCCGSTKSTLSGIGQPEIRPGPRSNDFSRDRIHSLIKSKNFSIDKHCNDTRPNSKESTQFGWCRDSTNILCNQSKENRKDGRGAYKIGNKEESKHIKTFRAHNYRWDIDYNEQPTSNECSPFIRNSVANEVTAHTRCNCSLNTVHS
mmetsp:Transcript_21362/g.42867  ORF Transcript_21362/g.42867 Transcript_21362/m.42867 type:complete len:232 (+) Transcript_21362:182-877(+)